jgi:hypothetical protein
MASETGGVRVRKRRAIAEQMTAKKLAQVLQHRVSDWV